MFRALWYDIHFLELKDFMLLLGTETTTNIVNYWAESFNKEIGQFKTRTINDCSNSKLAVSNSVQDTQVRQCCVCTAVWLDRRPA